jgi:4-amino-4-deoxy-L-arabinose transferase-like glycosyltransferase
MDRPANPGASGHAAWDAWLDRAAAAIGRWSPRRFFALLIAAQALLHIPVFPLPPMGQHTWRQMMWAAPARNWAEEGGRFFYPQHDVRVAADDKGYLYHEFPLLFWLIGQSYRVTGMHDINGRLLLFGVGIVLLIGAYALAKALGHSELRARWFTFFLWGSPWFFYYSVTLESSLPALAWFVVGLTALVPSLREGSIGWKFWIGMALITVGTVSKQTFLFFGLPVAFLFLYYFPRHRRFAVFGAGFAALLLFGAIHAAIYHHTLTLYEQAPIERQVYWELSSVPPPHSWAEAWHALIRPLMTWIPELFINTAALPFFAAGLVWAWTRREPSWERRGFWLAWTVSLLLFCATFLTRLRDHEYYLTPIVMLTALLSAGGAEGWFAARRLRWLAVVLVVLVPVVMVDRVHQRWTVNRQVPVELLEHAAELQRLIPPDARVVVVGDRSPLVYLYYLHRKGVSMRYDEESELPRLMRYGFRWAVSSRPLDAAPVLARAGTVVGQVGRFTVLRLNEQSPR